MKPLNELTHEELIALTPEQIDRYIQLRKAEEGLKIMLKPAACVLEPMPPPDARVYKVGGVSHAFGSAQEAADVSRALASCTGLIQLDWKYKGNKSVHVARPATNEIGGVSSEEAYSQELWDTIAEIYDRNGAEQGRFDKENKEYVENSKAAEYVIEEVMEPIRAARDVQYRRDQLKFAWPTYLDLAGGDEIIALRFLEKAQGILSNGDVAFVLGRPVTEAFTWSGRKTEEECVCND